MARLEIFEALCEFPNCAARATRQITNDDGSNAVFACTKHAQPMLIERTKKERAQKPAAVRP